METPQALFQSTKFTEFKAKTALISSVLHKTTGYKEDIFDLFNSRALPLWGRMIILMLWAFLDINFLKKSSFSNCCFVFNLYKTIALRNISKSEWRLSGCKSLCLGPGRWESVYLILVIKEKIQASADNSDSTLKLPDNWRKSGELLNVKKKKKLDKNASWVSTKPKVKC